MVTAALYDGAPRGREIQARAPHHVPFSVHTPVPGRPGKVPRGGDPVIHASWALAGGVV
jgi:hypothetical protein